MCHPHLSDLLKPFYSIPALCSQNSGLLSARRVKKKSAGCRAFCSCSILWNNLTADFKLSDSAEEESKHKLEMHLYSLIFTYCNVLFSDYFRPGTCLSSPASKPLSVAVNPLNLVLQLFVLFLPMRLL